MKFIEIFGGDTEGVRQDTLAVLAVQQVQTPDRVDAAQDKGAGAVRAVQTLSMFEPSRVVLVGTPEKVSVAVARDLAKLTHAGAVIFSGAKPVSAAVRRALPDLESRKHPLPQARDAITWVQARFREVQVNIPREVVGHLAEVATTTLGAARVRHLAAVLQACGVSDADRELLDALTFDLGVEAAVWAASDAVTRGDISNARPGEEAEPIVALSMLARRLARVGAALEGEADSAELARILETREGAVHMLTRGVTISPAQVSTAFDLVITAAAACRRVSSPAVTRAIADTASLRAARIFQAH